MGKGAVDANNDPSKMFSADVVAAVLTASATTSLTMKQYEMMSALDGTRTASSFQHAFRAVLAKSKELKGRVENGEVFEPVPPAIKRGGTSVTTSPATPKKRKNAGANNDDGTPAKKKVTPRKKVDDGPTDDFGSSGEDLPEDIDEFIKNEST